MLAAVRTMTCKDCKEVVDVLIERCGEVGRTGDPDFDKDFDICRKCRGKKLQQWPRKYPCPRCGDGMLKDNGPPIMWD